MVGLGHVEALAREMEFACKNNISNKKRLDVYDRFYAATQRALELVRQELIKMESFIQLKENNNALPNC